MCTIQSNENHHYKVEVKQNFLMLMHSTENITFFMQLWEKYQWDFTVFNIPEANKVLKYECLTYLQMRIHTSWLVF